MADNYDVIDLRQALWDIFGILGYDQDGDANPAAVGDLISTVVNAASEMRAEFDALQGAIPTVV